MNRKYLELYAISGCIILTVLILLVGKYYFGWFKTDTNNYVRYTPQPIETQKFSSINQEEIALLNNEINKDQTRDDIPKNFSNKKKIFENEKENSNNTVKKEKRIAYQQMEERKGIQRLASSQKQPLPKTPLPSQEEKIARNGISPQRGKSSSLSREFPLVLNEQNFHSLGEYVSKEEKWYRNELIGQLTVNTIVIDRLSKGNGISQEFYRVAYIMNMIPSKILKDIVESKEFRDLIPKNLVEKEGHTTNDLKSGETVTFSAFSIKKLLILWSEGKLTPIQKAWLVGAEDSYR